MPNPENVIGKGNRWKKGQSGNPKGRPKKIPELSKALALVMGEEKEEYNALEMILLKIRGEAMKGNIRAAELLLRYCFPNGLTGTQETDIEMVWTQINPESDNEIRNGNT
jgi:hypothetical protein